MTKFPRTRAISYAVLASALSLTLPLFATSAHAMVELNLMGAASLLQGAAHNGLTEVSPMIGANLLFSAFPFISIGPVVENNFIFNHSSVGHRSYIGGDARFELGSTFFLDGTLGASAINYGNGGTSDYAFSGGADLGFMSGRGFGTSIGPFIGYRYTPTKYGSGSTDGSVIDLGLMISLGM